jgi:hypothetical protein
VKLAATPERGAASKTKPLKVTPLGNFETFNAKRAKPAMQKPTTKMLKNMKLKINAINLARAALVAAAALSAPSVFADVVQVTSNPGDLFIGFRTNSGSSDLVADIGSYAQFIPSTLTGYGGTWNSQPFNISFGVIPNTSTPVNNLSADLSATFGGSWSSNPTDGSGVHWAVLGFTSTNQNNTPISGLNKNSLFLTKAETTLGTKSATLSLSTSLNATVASDINNIVTGSFGYQGSNSTVNSSVAVSQVISGNANAWSTQVGNQNAALGTSLDFEQAPNGSNSGPTNSVLDLYLRPGTGSALGTTVQYLGSFALDSGGDLTYAPSSYFAAVPEPGSTVLLGFGLAALVPFLRRRNKIDA